MDSCAVSYGKRSSIIMEQIARCHRTIQYNDVANCNAGVSWKNGKVGEGKVVNHYWISEKVTNIRLRKKFSLSLVVFTASFTRAANLSCLHWNSYLAQNRSAFRT